MAQERFIIVTGGDSRYYPLFRELMESIRAFPQGRHCPIGIIDAGLTEEQRRALAAEGCLLATPGWEYDLSPMRTVGQDHVRAEIAKIFLPRHFPGFGSIIWIDADAWVQDWAAIDLLLQAAEMGRFGIVAQTGRFRPTEVTVRWLFHDLGRIRSILGKAARKTRLPAKVKQDLALRPNLNGGVFSARSDAPHWAVFQRRHADVIHHCRLFSSVQLAFALGIFIDGMPVELLPEWCNYLGPWRYDPAGPKPWVEHYLPNRPVGIVHMAGADAMRRDPTVRDQFLGMDEKLHWLTLRYPAWAKRLADGAPDLLAATAAEGEAQPGQGGPGLQAVVD